MSLEVRVTRCQIRSSLSSLNKHVEDSLTVCFSLLLVTQLGAYCVLGLSLLGLSVCLGGQSFHTLSTHWSKSQFNKSLPNNENFMFVIKIIFFLSLNLGYQYLTQFGLPVCLSKRHFLFVVVVVVVVVITEWPVFKGLVLGQGIHITGYLPQNNKAQTYHFRNLAVFF